MEEHDDPSGPAFQGLAFPDDTIDLYYSRDSQFLMSLHAARQGLALYANQQH